MVSLSACRITIFRSRRAIARQNFEKQFNAGGIRSQKDIFDLFATVGIPQAKVEEAYDSFAVKNLVRKASTYSQQSGISGTPSFMVAGKYLVSPSQAGTHERAMQIVDYLLAQEAN